MRILFLTLSNIYDLNQSGIYTDLMREFKDKGSKVTIVSPSERRLGEKTRLIESEQVQILKVRIGNITKTNRVEKGLTTLQIDRTYLKAIKKYLGNEDYDIVLYSTPPISFIKTLTYLKRKKNVTSYLMLKDIFPQNAVDIGMMSKNSLLYKFFRNKEKKLYEISDLIGCMSEANVNYIINKNKEVDPEKVHILPNAITPKKREFIDSDIIKNKYEIPINKTILLYGGNIGKPQGIDFLLKNLIEIEKEFPEYFFVIVGSGTEFKKTKNFVLNSKVSNCLVLDKVSKSDFDDLCEISDLGIIMLDYRFTIPNFPSRILSYMDASIPILAITDEATDVGEIIESNDFGFFVPSNDRKKLFDTLDKINEIDLSKLGINSRKFLEENYTVNIAQTIIKDNIEKIKGD